MTGAQWVSHPGNSNVTYEVNINKDPSNPLIAGIEDFSVTSEQYCGGPLFDMGPYYITALVRLLGRVKSVFAVGTKAFEERTITSKPKYGQKIPVKVDTHNVGILSFENGAVITLVTSFDVIKHSMPNIELYGSKGSLIVPDPNKFGGAVQLATQVKGQYTEMPLISKYSENSRGIGVSWRTGFTCARDYGSLCQEF